ncbi:hypothetical protein [Amycolatopsis sp. NPDC059657]|uniref:hypothetical protein n=1 Tax=Amycolatopsis sp. NPDC059657 TaxID=3346899 RepID=UPI00366FFEF2
MDAFEHAEEAVGTAMLGYVVKRALSTLLVAALTALAELAVVVLAVIGVCLLDGWVQFGAAVVLVATMLVRPLRVWRRKRRTAEPASRRSRILTKFATVPVNAIGYPAFSAGMAWPYAVAACTALLVVEFGLWFAVIGPHSKRLKQISEFLKDTDAPRTWEI